LGFDLNSPRTPAALLSEMVPLLQLLELSFEVHRLKIIGERGWVALVLELSSQDNRRVAEEMAIF
jgi:hypothetical protein